MDRLRLFCSLLLLAGPLLAGSGAPGPGRPAPGRPPAKELVATDTHPRIINGLPTGEYPSTVALLLSSDPLVSCSGTLVGCQTVLTAAHCVCLGDGTGSDCQADGPALASPGDLVVFSQHFGFAAVESIQVPETFEFGVRDDVAVLRLAAPVTGIATTPINETATPPLGEKGTIVGFGRDEADFGMKRVGKVELAVCEEVPEEPHLCWNFDFPQGAVGEDSNTCTGDSGGPLFVDFGDGPRVAGVTSGGVAPNCLPEDRAWDADVFFSREWIRQAAGDDLDLRLCGELPPAGSATAPIFTASDTVSLLAEERAFTVDVPEGVDALRFTLNGHEEDGANDYDLFVRAGEAPTVNTFDCESRRSGVYEVCEVLSPASGTWHILVDRFAGGGQFQVTATAFGVPTGGCVASETTLCIDDEPGDRRFELTVHYRTVAGGGREGDGQAIPLAGLGIRRGGLFWFFSQSNPELLIKVLNGCPINGRYWVFWSAGTNAGLVVRVHDTHTGEVVEYLNTDGKAAQPVTDTDAFACENGA